MEGGKGDGQEVLVWPAPREGRCPQRGSQALYGELETLLPQKRGAPGETGSKGRELAAPLWEAGWLLQCWKGPAHCISMHYELGPANHLVGLCYSKVRYLPILLRDRLRQEGLWEDLKQELYSAAWEAWKEGLGEKETYRLAAKRVYAFLKAYGYRAYRKGFWKLERPFSEAYHGRDIEDRGLPPPEGPPRPFFVPGGQDHLEEKLLALLRRHPQGLGKPQVCARLGISAHELDWCCAPLVERGLLKEVRRENSRGRYPTPLLLDGSVAVPEEAMAREDKKERIRRLYLEGKSMKGIAREFHHSMKTVRRAIAAGVNLSR